MSVSGMGAGVRERDGVRGRVLGSGVGRGGRVVLDRETSVKGLFWEPWSRGVVCMFAVIGLNSYMSLCVLAILSV